MTRHNKAYSKEIIEQAKKLFENGMSYEKISKTLNIKRIMTVRDWAVKFKWHRKNSGPNTKFIFCNEQDIKDLEGAGRKAIAFLLADGKFRSMTEAIDVLDRIRQFLDLAVRLSDVDFDKNDENEEKNKSICKILDINSEKGLNISSGD